jgi:hypothetical protein
LDSSFKVVLFVPFSDLLASAFIGWILREWGCVNGAFILTAREMDGFWKIFLKECLIHVWAGFWSFSVSFSSCLWKDMLKLCYEFVNELYFYVVNRVYFFTKYLILENNYWFFSIVYVCVCVCAKTLLKLPLTIHIMIQKGPQWSMTF